MMQPAVTVIIPACNAERHLQTCLDSVDAQRAGDSLSLQVIIVDDGSTDDTGIIADRYASSHSDVLVLHTPNGGLSTARNRALEHAGGRWLTFLDSDDTLSPASLLPLVQYGDSCGADIVQGVMQLRGVRVKSRGRIGSDDCLTIDAETAMGHVLTEKIFTTAQGRLYRADVYGDLLFADGLYFEDVIWTAQALTRCKVYAVVNSPFYIYVYNDSSITGRVTRRHLDLFTTLDRRMELVRQRFPRLLSQATRLTFYNASRVVSHARDQKTDCFGQIQDAYNRLTAKYRDEIRRYVPWRLRMLYTNPACDFCYTKASKFYGRMLRLRTKTPAK